MCLISLVEVGNLLLTYCRGDISATCDVSRLQVKGKLFDSRIQGGVLADGFNGMLAGLCTIVSSHSCRNSESPLTLDRHQCPLLPKTMELLHLQDVQIERRATLAVSFS